MTTEARRKEPSAYEKICAEKCEGCCKGLVKFGLTPEGPWMHMQQEFHYRNGQVVSLPATICTAPSYDTVISDLAREVEVLSRLRTENAALTASSEDRLRQIEAIARERDGIRAENESMKTAIPKGVRTMKCPLCQVVHPEAIELLNPFVKEAEVSEPKEELLRLEALLSERDAAQAETRRVGGLLDEADKEAEKLEAERDALKIALDNAVTGINAQADEELRALRDSLRLIGEGKKQLVTFGGNGCLTDDCTSVGPCTRATGHDGPCNGLQRGDCRL